MHYISTLYSLFFNPYICFGLYKAIFRRLINYIHFTYNVFVCCHIGCEVNVVYEPPEDGFVKAETYVRVEE
jgi:hypothetical protein